MADILRLGNNFPIREASKKIRYLIIRPNNIEYFHSLQVTYRHKKANILTISSFQAAYGIKFLSFEVKERMKQLEAEMASNSFDGLKDAHALTAGTMLIIIWENNPSQE